MTDPWRIKRYYKPRVLIPLADLTDSPLPDGLYYLTGAQLGVVRTLLQYAHRRITWVSEYGEQTYLTPTTEEWDDVELFIADLEEAFMTSCCQELLDAIAGLQATANTIASGVASIDAGIATSNGWLEDINTVLELILAKQEHTEVTVTVNPDWEQIPDVENYFRWGYSAPDQTVPAQVDAEACALAQAWYQAGFEWMTEVVLPVMRFGFDKVLPATTALLAVITGGATIPVAMGVYTIAEVIQELLETAYDVAETNLENWLLANKDELVCPMYVALSSGATMSTTWPDIYNDIVAPSGDLSAGDKFLISFCYRVLAMPSAYVAKQQDSQWYQASYTPGFCDSCPQPPIVGATWYAIPCVGAEHEHILNHTAGSYWLYTCATPAYDVPAGERVCGCFVEILEHTGTCQECGCLGAQAGCTVDNLMGNDGGTSYAEGQWYYYTNGTDHDENNAIAVLHPGAILKNIGYRKYGPAQVQWGFQSGYNCTGYTRLAIRYIVFDTPPPP